MRDQNIQSCRLENGLTVVVEQMADVQSAAFSLLVRSGSIFDPPQQSGSASVLCELSLRGAGDFDSRRLTSALDNLGLQHGESVGSTHMTFGGATLAERLPDAMRIYSNIIRRPHLPPEQFDAACAGVEQSLTALEDEPRQKIFIELRRRCFDAPWGLPSEGELADLPNLSAASIRQHYDRCFRPDDAILGVAGNVEFGRIRELAEELFGDWSRQPEPTFDVTPGGPSRGHLHHDSAQTHIGIAWPSVPYRDPQYYDAWAAVSVLSGGMSSRLFTEVREKRGLCYSVHASLTSLRDAARVLCYAGTTPERAQETLDVTLAEIHRLQDGILKDELERCKARAKSSLVMQQESTTARSSAMARDWYHLGRVTTLTEVRDAIDRLTVDSVLGFVRSHPIADLTVLTIGSKPLDLPAE